MVEVNYEEDTVVLRLDSNLVNRETVNRLVEYINLKSVRKNIELVMRN